MLNRSRILGELGFWRNEFGTAKDKLVDKAFKQRLVGLPGGEAD